MHAIDRVAPESGFGGQSSSGEFMLFLFGEVDGIANVSDSQIRELYERAKQEGVGELVFRDGTVDSATDFLREMKAPGTTLFLLYSRGLLAGFVFLNRFEGRSARIHFCLFRLVWGRESRALGHWTLRQLLWLRDGEGRFVFDMLLGYVPEANPIACRYCRKIGGRVEGRLPYGGYCFREGRSEPVKVFSITRESLNESLH